MLREISAKSLIEGQKSLVLNGFARFPIVLSYCAMGLFIGTYYYLHPDLMKMIPESRPDLMAPIFILNTLPHGIIGFLFVAILAAAMSSLDSMLNSLSATTMNDFLLPWFKKKGKTKDATILLYSRLTTIFWGLFAICFAFFTESISESIIVAINKIGSLFYGSIAAAFAVGTMTKRAGGLSVRVGIVVGVLFNFILWKFAPGVSWLWWNAAGFIMTFAISWIFGNNPEINANLLYQKNIDWYKSHKVWKRSVYLLIIFGIVIIIFTYWLPFII